MAGRKQGSSNAKPGDIEQALSEWVRLGTAEKAAASVKRPVGTIHGWRHKHPEIWKRLEGEHAEEVRERHRANVREAWADAADAAREAARELREGAQLLSPRDRRQLAGIVLDFARMGDHSMRLDAGDPTSVVETRSRDELVHEAREHAARLREMGFDLDAPSVDHTGPERH